MATTTQPPTNTSGIDVPSPGNGEIILKNMSTSSEGAYVCEAYNGIGITQKVFYIIVNGNVLQLLLAPFELYGVCLLE